MGCNAGIVPWQDFRTAGSRGVHVKSSINILKMTPPHLPQLLYRRRLLELLEKNRDKKLILILGQAAQGKSTLASFYVKTSTIPSAWMNLGPEDSDPVNLFRLIVQSLRHALKGIDLSQLLSHPLEPSEPLDQRPDIPLYRDWARSIFERLADPIHMIMDGLERLSPDSPSFHLIQVLVEDAPPHIRLILLSREIPPLSFGFQHLKIRQEALILTNEDLAFTEEEIKNFFKRSRRLLLSEEQIRRIHSATQGWVGGLILLSEALARMPGNSLKKHISQEMPAQFKREVFQYFGKEIFFSLSSQVQSFLTKSSIIGLIEPGFMQDLIGTGDSEEILRGLVRKNLFVQSIQDEKRGWLFQYHPLFRDFLRTKFESTIGVEERRFLALKAGYLFEQRNELENAVHSFLQAKAYPQAISIIEPLGMEFLRMGRKADLAGWLGVLPQEVVRDNPWLLFYRAMTSPYPVGRESLISIERAYAIFKQQQHLRGVLISLAQLIYLSIHTGTNLAFLAPLIKEGEDVLLSPDLDQFSYESAMLWYCIGAGHILVEGDIRKGIWACQNAYLISGRIKDLTLQGYALTFSALGLTFLGEFPLANQALTKIERLTEGNAPPELRARQLMIHCILANYQGSFMKSQVLAEKLQIEIERFALVSMTPWVYEIMGYVKLCQREFQGALEIANRYLTAATSIKNEFLRGLSLKLHALIYLHQRDFPRAKEAALQSIEAFTLGARSQYERQNLRILMGLIHYHLKDYEDAEKELEEAWKYFDAISDNYALAEIRFVSALLKEDQGKSREAASLLMEGFRIAEEKKYEHLYLLSRDDLAQVCILAIVLKVQKSVPYATHLLSTRHSSITEEKLKELSVQSDPSIRERAWQIRRTIRQSTVPRLYVQTLGGFQVSRGSRPMEETEWDRNQPKELLKAIVSHGGQKLSKDTLMDDLWPDERPASAEKNFKTTLRRLRKSLEPEIDPEFGSSYIHLHDTFVSLNSELVQLDADLFLSLLRKGEERERGGDLKAALSLYTEAMEMYKGDFLPEDSYAPWADMKRVELRRKYVDLLHHVAKLHETQGARKKAIACYRKAIETDPLLEESYQRLMVLYSTKGMQNEALRVYEDCQRVLKRGLKSKPDPVTTALYNKIIEKLRTL